MMAAYAVTAAVSSKSFRPRKPNQIRSRSHVLTKIAAMSDKQFRVCCKLHNICIDRSKLKVVIDSNDYIEGDDATARYTDGTDGNFNGRRFDLERAANQPLNARRLELIKELRDKSIVRPRHSTAMRVRRIADRIRK